MRTSIIDHPVIAAENPCPKLSILSHINYKVGRNSKGAEYGMPTVESSQCIRGTNPTMLSGALIQTLNANSSVVQGTSTSSSIEKTASVCRCSRGLNLLFKLSSTWISNSKFTCLGFPREPTSTKSFKELRRSSEGEFCSLHTTRMASTP